MTNAPTATPSTAAAQPNLLPAAPAAQPPVNTAAMTLQQQQQYQAYQQQLQQQQAQAAQPVPQQQQQQQPPAAQPQPVAQPVPPASAQAQAQQAQHLPHQGLNGGWQSDKDVQERRKMIAKIVHLLQQRKPNAPQEWLKKLPQMAKRLEESLYRSAKSFDEYNDATTLKQRLQQLAVNIGMKTKKMQQAQLAKQQAQQQAQQAQQQQQQVQQPAPSQFQPLQNQQQFQAQQQQLAAQNQQQAAVQPQPVAAPAPPQALQQPQIIQPQPQAPGRQIVNMSDINPIMGGSPAPAPPQQPRLSSVGSSASGNAAVPGSQAAPPGAVPNQGQFQPIAAPSAQGQASTAKTPAPAGSETNGSRGVSDRQQVLRHQQQRLLLLRHAAKCQHEDGRCPVTPHCAGMKRLWKHIAECKDQKCLVPHCVSSRYVLSHYHRCKDVRCPVCGPVREAIHRSHEKQKQMQALKQRHQQAVQQQASVQGTAPTSGAQQPARQGSISTATEPAPKRQKTALPVGSGVPAYVQRQHGAVQQRVLGGPKGAAIPTQPSQPTVKPGYVYSQTGGARPGAPGLAYSNGQVIMPKHSGPKPQEDHTLINCFSIEQIETHIASLNTGLQLTPQKLKTKCLDVLKVLQSHQHGWVFNSPVDPVELGLPDYFEVIKKPMDLGTIKKKLENGCYHSIDEFEDHVHLTFDNAMLYNPDGSVVWKMAKEMKDKFTADFAQLIKQLNAEEEIKRRNGEACLLCGCEKLLFEPPVFYCNGLNCPSKRIRRNSYYYVAGNNQYHWCHQCFGELRDHQVLELGDITVRKEQLTKKKNDEVHEESWVQCDKCERWVHQICALFNTRQNKDQRSEFTCPRCTIDERKKKGITEGTSTTPMAEDLPRTKLSQRLENHVRKKVDEYFDERAKEKSQREGIPLEEAKKGLSMGGAITIRQVTSMDRKLEVRERMKRRYAFKNYPDEFTFRCKCIVVFQNLDGVDVILFGLYVYEHDEKNPAPNTRTVYISYLDSVHFMRPRNMRTLIYHEILIAYLDYVREKNFKTAHIWACPPLKGDDYILYAKPEDQKTPKDDRLRQWYFDMLLESQKRGIVGKVTNMYDLYFADEKNDASIVPYMDGDYFPAEAENIIKDIEEGKSGKKGAAAGKKKTGNKSKTKKKSGRGGTRSAGLDEEAFAASGVMPQGMGQKSLEQGGRDYVMVKLGETIQPMKESFFVAFLACKDARPEDMVVPKEVEEYRKEHGIVSKNLIVEDESHMNEDHLGDAETKDGAEADENVEMKPADVEAKPSDDAEKNPLDDAADTVMSDAKPTDGSKTDEGTKTEVTADSIAPASGKVKEEPSTAGEPEATKKEDTTPAGEPQVKTEEPSTDDSKAPDASEGKADGGANAGEKKAEGETNAATDASTVAPTGASDASKPTTGEVEKSTGDEKEKSTGDEKKDDTPKSKEDEEKAKAEAAKEAQIASIRGGKFAAMAKRNKRDIDGNPKGEAKKEEADKKADGKEKEVVSKSITVKDSQGRTVKVIDDDLEEMDCEFLNNRQAFLNLCQGNHYQFDMLRRAKHSSMMVLWHLHNRDAPKFVQQCAICSREILTGYRYHCPTCADYDQCHDCVSNPNTPRHPHQLKPIPVASGQQTELTEAQRKERQRSIQLHMTLLLHAATCKSPKCPSANCTKMKGLLKHGAQCQVKATGGCHVCKRIWALLQLHARQCKAPTCPVPNCMAIRERFRQLKKQQQAMDDRRRQEMNRHARLGMR